MVEADLVIDASGRSSHWREWLRALSIAAPRESVVDGFVGYATRLYRSKEDGRADWRAIIVQSKPPKMTSGGVVLEVENGDWLVGLIGMGRDYPSNDEQGFLDFAMSLRSSVLYETIRGAEPVGPIATYRGATNRLVSFDESDRWPEGLAVVGDALATFNPVYGQGMTVAAEQALVLRDWLRRRTPCIELQHRLRKAVWDAWLLATGEDFRFPTTIGHRPFGVGLAHRYIDRVVRAASVDGSVFIAFARVSNLQAAPSTLFRPGIAARTLLVAPLRRRQAGPPSLSASGTGNQR